MRMKRQYKKELESLLQNKWNLFLSAMDKINN